MYVSNVMYIKEMEDHPIKNHSQMTKKKKKKRNKHEHIGVNFIISSHVRIFALSFAHFATSNGPKKVAKRREEGMGNGSGSFPMGIDIISHRA